MTTRATDRGTHNALLDSQRRVLERIGSGAPLAETLNTLIDALRKSEDSLRVVIDTIPARAWSILPDGTLDFVNQRWLEYTGLSLEEAIEEPTRTMHPDDLPREKAHRDPHRFAW